MSKFRNMVVHLYDKIDEKEIYNIIKNHLEDFEYFIEVIFNNYIEEKEEEMEEKED